MNNEFKNHLSVLANGDLPALERQDAINSLRFAVSGGSYEHLHFPARLHKLASCHDLFPFIFWSDDGKSFIVERDGFKKYVMNIFFSQTKLKSFQNLLSKYHFRSTSVLTPHLHSTIGKDNAWKYMAYNHPLFEQDREDLCRDIRRSLVPASYTAPPTDKVLLEAETTIQNEARRIEPPETTDPLLPSHKSPTSATAFIHHQFADVFDKPPPLATCTSKEIPPICSDDDAFDIVSVSSSPEIDAQFE